MNRNLILQITSDLQIHHVQNYLSLGKTIKDHPTDLIIGDVSRGVKTRSQALNECSHLVFQSHIEPRNINEALNNEFWFLALQEELNNFDRNNIWDLVQRPKDVLSLAPNELFVTS